jgi:hypothetical protein
MALGIFHHLGVHSSVDYTAIDPVINDKKKKKFFFEF